jgi:hypothetical protein
MRLSDRFSLAELPVTHSDHEFTRWLVCDGKPTDIRVHGDGLAGQYECEGAGVFLLVTQYDHYESVAHWFYVVTRDGEILDQATTPDYFGFLERPVVEPPATLAFGFYGTHDQWRVRVQPTGVWSFDRLALRLRLNRFLLRKRYMTFACQPGAPWGAKA